MNAPKPRAIIVDIDGTIASHVNPDGSLRRGHFEYPAVINDVPIQPVIKLVELLRASGLMVLFCSGRPEFHGATDVHALTREWLLDHVGQWAAQAPLFMRPTGDRRPDAIVKAEIFDRLIKPNFDIQYAFDDRNRVVTMWRSRGLTCLQVAEGDF